MARPKNKYERIQEKRRRLDRLYNRGANDHYPCGVEFIIHDGDCGEKLYNECKCCYDCKYRCVYYEDKSRYLTWERPIASNYTAVRFYPSKHNSQVSRTKFYKRYSNKILRKKKEVYNGNQYRKVFDFWWSLY